MNFGLWLNYLLYYNNDKTLHNNIGQDTKTVNLQKRKKNDIISSVAVLFIIGILIL